MLHARFGVAPSPSGSWLDVPVALLSAYRRLAPHVEAQNILRDVTSGQIVAAGRKAKRNVDMLQRQSRVPVKAKPARPEELSGRVSVDVRAVPSWGEELLNG